MLGDSQTIVEEDYDLGIENGRRESNIGNDDDYDYALELLEDDEYRCCGYALINSFEKLNFNFFAQLQTYSSGNAGSKRLP